MSFTIKHRESDALGGTEYLYSAEKVEVVRKGEHFEDGIFLDPEGQSGIVPDTIPGVPAHTPVRFASTVVLFGGNQTEDAQKRQGGKVWIMNEAGSTVASYDL